MCLFSRLTSCAPAVANACGSSGSPRLWTRSKGIKRPSKAFKGRCGHAPRPSKAFKDLQRPLRTCSKAAADMLQGRCGHAPRPSKAFKDLQRPLRTCSKACKGLQRPLRTCSKACKGRCGHAPRPAKAAADMLQGLQRSHHSGGHGLSRRSPVTYLFR